ncbi:FAD-binding oxidoreductase [Nocardia sp. NPDC051570]|uniref:FAD-binding oxidoreductase n=1 Tax=Nocardia sp. NPDC051570 TaxID=3364324 RepID=UPI003796031F
MKISDLTVVTKDSDTYDQARKCWNAMYDSRPDEIIYCKDSKDVSSAIEYARDAGKQFRIRSGGHGTEGYCSVDDGIVIDVSSIDHIEYVSDSLVRLGPGIKNRKVNHVLAERGQAVTTGTCYDVSVGGFALGGGSGMLSRTLRSFTRSVVSMEIVDARGRILTADKDTNPDLFWACRGSGGGNFGVVTNFTVRAHKIPDVVSYRVMWPWQHLETVLDRWQHWAVTDDRRLNSYFTIMPQSVGWIDVGGVFVGPQKEFEEYLTVLLRETPPSTERSVRTLPWTEAAEVIYDKVGGGLPEFHERIRSSNLTNNSSNFLDAEAIKVLKEHHAKAFGNIWTWIWAAATESDLSSIAEVERDTAEQFSFSNRLTLLSVLTRAGWKDPSEDARHMDWFKDFQKSWRPYSSACYVNWTDRRIETRLGHYFGDNLPRLVEVKNAWDPHDVFNFPASIPLRVTADQARRWELSDDVVQKLKDNGRFVDSPAS